MWAFLGVLLVLHGIAHLVGVMTPFGLTPRPPSGGPPPYDPRQLLDGRVVLSRRASSALALLWLLAAAGFIVTGIGFLQIAPWALTAAALLALGSMLLCIGWWPASRVGFWIDALLLGIIGVITRA